MGMCFVPDCKHYSERDRCSFFRFPLDDKVKKIWIKNIRRADAVPSKYAKVCSCHFKDNLKVNTPTIFERNKSKILTFQSPEKKKNKRLSTSSNARQTEPNAIEFRNSENLGNPQFVSATDRELQSNCRLSTFGNSKQTDPNTAEFSNSETSENPQFGSAFVRELQSNVVLLSCEKDIMMKEIDDLKTKINKLEKQPFGYRTIRGKNNFIMYYTGLPNSEIFELILKICTANPINYYAGWNVEKLTQEDQLLLTLMRLKLNLGGMDLTVRFSVSAATVSNVVLTWIYLLHEIVFENLMSEIPSQAKNKVCLPACFDSFKNCRMVLDCIEILTEIPKKMDQQKLFYSNNKHRNTMKALLGIAPNGVITYVSELYPGSTSDREVFKNSNLHNIFQQGDLILTDKGFLISDLLPPEVHVNIPPFLFSPQFTPDQILETTNIARARIHVERAIRRVQVFKITRMIPKTLFKFSSKIFQVCAALTNFQSPLLREV